MAGIDKTYVNYQQYQDAKTWLEKQTDPVLKTIYLYPEPESEKEKKYFVLWNTSTVQDIALLKLCPLDFVQERIKDVHLENSVKVFSKFDHTQPTYIKEITYGKSTFKFNLEEEYYLYGTDLFLNILGYCYDTLGRYNCYSKKPKQNITFKSSVMGADVVTYDKYKHSVDGEDFELNFNCKNYNLIKFKRAQNIEELQNVPLDNIIISTIHLPAIPEEFDDIHYYTKDLYNFLV